MLFVFYAGHEYSEYVQRILFHLVNFEATIVAHAPQHIAVMM